MTEKQDAFAAWLEQADIPHSRLTPQVLTLLQAVFRFRQQQGLDYYSTRLLSHFLLHCDCGLKVAQIARLLRIARPTASKQQKLSSKETIGQAHHRMAGRPYGKLLPRFAGPIIAFLLGHPNATRSDLLDFIQRTFAVRVSRIALWHFLKKYGIDLNGPAPAAQPSSDTNGPAPPVEASPDSNGPAPPAEPSTNANQPQQQSPAAGPDSAATHATDDSAPLEPVPPAPLPVPLPLPAPPSVPLALPAPPSVPLAPPAPVPSPTVVLPPAATGGAALPLWLGRTQYAGAFLLLGHALDWLAVARDCFSDTSAVLTRGLLTSVFAPVIGLERIYHLDSMDDLGFAVLTGGRRCPSRYSVAAWQRHLPWYEVDTFCRRSSPWQIIRGETALVSYDEHSIPRWTHKFHIKKGYVTTRNKYMRCEKLFYSYDLLNKRYLAVRATPGNVGLVDMAVPLLRQTLRYGQPSYLHGVFDAGAGKSDAGVRGLWELVEEEDPRLDVTMRASRYPHRVKKWKALAAEQFEVHSEAGPYVAAKAKEIRLAETTTVLKDESQEQGVRTVVCREVVPGPKKDRWHPLFTSTADVVGAEEVLSMYRKRQRHEQSYRVGVHDESLDAIPCGYDKNSPEPLRPRWQRGGMQMRGWLVALVYNAVADLAEELAGDYSGSHVRTMRRMFFNRPGTLYQTKEALIVYLEPFKGQEALIPIIDQFNAKAYRLPWLHDRQVVLSLTPYPPHGGP